MANADIEDTLGSQPEGKVKPPALNEGFYSLDPEELAFYKAQTGIDDENELKKHIMQAQADAYEVKSYSCIRSFGFLRLKISRLSAYSQLLQLGRERQGAIFLDIGCCFGNDVRKAVADGFPIQNAIASDLIPEFWQSGHRLFKSSPETFPVPFLAGDAFNATFLNPVSPFYSPPETAVPPLSSLTTLTPLLGHVSAIHASSFFHLFDEAEQLQLAHALAGLLSPQPGSMLFGQHGSREEKGYRTGQLNWRGTYMFCHSPESWTELWDGQVFKKGTVRVDARLRQGLGREVPDAKAELKFWMDWSVTRL